VTGGRRLLRPEGLDPFATASLLARRWRDRPLHLILTGRQAADTKRGQVAWAGAALGIPAVSVAGKVEIDGDKARVETMLPDGYQVVEASLPLR